METITRSVDPFWFNEPKILFDKNRISEFFPVNSMTHNEKMNAIMRMSIYLAVIFMLYNKSIKIFMAPLFIALVTLYIYRMNDVQKKSEKVEGFVEEETCQGPTADNPFMNTLVTDVGQYKERKEACLIEDKIEEVEKHFNKGLFKDVGDLWEKGNSQRQFFTMPNTTEYGIKHGDTNKFANWLFNTGNPTCKEDTNACTNSFTYYTEELRNKPHLLVK